MDEKAVKLRRQAEAEFLEEKGLGPTDIRASLIVLTLSLLPYPIVSWLYMRFADGDVRDFWIALGVICVARVFFAIIEVLGAELAWRLYSRRRQVKAQVARFKAISFPKRKYWTHNLWSHLAWMEAGEHGPAAKTMAAEIRLFLRTCRECSVLAGIRMDWATHAAFELYSPATEAPDPPHWNREVGAARS